MPAVSVIIPVYNVEQYVGRCVRSLFSQTLDDIEFIFIDDCSPDNSVTVVREVLENEFPARKPQARFFRMPVNSGQAAVRMKGLGLATGDYVIHCDADDELLSPDAYGRMYGKAVAGNLDIVSCNYLVEDASGQERLVREECTDVRQLLLDEVQGSLCCRLVRLSLLKDILPPAGNMGEDLVISVQATLRAKASGHVDEAFYLYRYRANSISKERGKDSAVKRHKALVPNIKLLADLLVDTYRYRGDSPEMVCFKYYARHCIEPYVGDRECYRLWKDTFPEIDGSVLSNPFIPLWKKCRFVLIRLHLYGPLRWCSQRLGKLLKRK